MTNRRKTPDALYVDRIRLFQTDPERYFREYPRQKFGFQPKTASDVKRPK